MTLSGNVFIGKQKSGTLLNIPPGEERTVTSDLILGWGKTIVTVSATHAYSSVTMSQNATILLFFIKIKV
jgi:hypothetical protein